MPRYNAWLSLEKIENGIVHMKCDYCPDSHIEKFYHKLNVLEKETPDNVLAGALFLQLPHLWSLWHDLAR